MTRIVDVLIVHQREEPGTEVRTGFPKMLLNQGPNQRVLDQVIGALDISGQRARITVQKRDLLFEKALKSDIDFSSGHNGHSRIIYRECKLLMCRSI